MPNPYNFQITRIVKSNEINFRSLYLYHNWTVCDGPGRNATVVACINGNGNGNTFSLVFKVGRFKESTLRVMRIPVEEGKWAIVGGTGQFARATGVISKKTNDTNWPIKHAIHAFCPLPEGSRVRSLVTKIGPFGGRSRGTHQDITVAPWRLKSITVCDHKDKVVKSIAFSYIDHGGKRHTSRLGCSRGKPAADPIPLDPSDFVKKVTGRFGTYKGNTVILSLKFVTNNKPNGYGPFGRTDEEGTRFSVPVLDSSVIVGFFGRGGEYLNAVGVYVHPF